MRRLPPFKAIRAFEAASRYLSFKLAAEELCVTRSAISHQIKALEEYLATDLFYREGNQLTLTITGEGYAGKLTTLLDSLDRSTREAAGPGQSKLRVLATPGFAARWLVPRLTGLDSFKKIRLQVSEGAPDTDFSSNNADVVIQWGETPVSGVSVRPFMSTGRYPVASPELVQQEKIRRPEDLHKLTLFRDEVQDGWTDWFLEAGLDMPAPQSGPVFPHCELATTAAEQGLGVALAYGTIVRTTVESGRLVRLFNIETKPRIIYSVACQQDRADEPEVRKFCDWIFKEMEKLNPLSSARLRSVG